MIALLIERFLLFCWLLAVVGAWPRVLARREHLVFDVNGRLKDLPVGL